MDENLTTKYIIASGITMAAMAGIILIYKRDLKKSHERNIRNNIRAELLIRIVNAQLELHPEGLDIPAQLMTDLNAFYIMSTNKLL